VFAYATWRAGQRTFRVVQRCSWQSRDEGSLGSTPLSCLSLLCQQARQTWRSQNDPQSTFLALEQPPNVQVCSVQNLEDETHSRTWLGLEC
jgi:hypothetical protein